MLYVNIVTCPTNVTGLTCSGHGVCWDMADLAADAGQVYGSSALTKATVAWDYNIMKGCLCNSSWAVGYGHGEYQVGEYFQPDCSMSKSHYNYSILIIFIPCMYSYRALSIRG